MPSLSRKITVVFSLLGLGAAAVIAAGLLLAGSPGRAAAVYAEASSRYSIMAQKAEAGSADRPAFQDQSLENMLHALMISPHHSLYWVRFAHILKMNGADDMQIEEALDIAALLSPDLKYDILKHREYLMPVEAEPKGDGG